MTFSDIANLGEIISALGVVGGLIFVGLQMRQHTMQLQRAERNVANAEASAMRHAILSSQDLAEIVHSGVAGDRTLNPVELDRLNWFFWEMGFLALQLWDRTKNGLFQREEEFEKIVQSFGPFFTSLAGLAWWREARKVFRPDFVIEIENLLPSLRAAATPPTPGPATDAQT